MKRVKGAKNKRAIRTFEADPEIDSMLERALGAGLKIGAVCNEALRSFGAEAIDYYGTLSKALAKDLKEKAANSPSTLDKERGSLLERLGESAQKAQQADPPIKGNRRR